jgi:hypothetical protein
MSNYKCIISWYGCLQPQALPRKVPLLGGAAMTPAMAPKTKARRAAERIVARQEERAEVVGPEEAEEHSPPNSFPFIRNPEARQALVAISPPGVERQYTHGAASVRASVGESGE